MTNQRHAPVHQRGLRSKFIRYDFETRKSGGSERRRDGNVGRITPAGDHDTPYPRTVVPGVEREPAAIKKDFIPCAEIHRRRIGWHADIAKITRAVTRRYIHAAGQRHARWAKSRQTPRRSSCPSEAVRSPRAW